MPKSVSIGVHLAAGLLHKDVGRLQVAVDDAVGVAGGERVGYLRGEQSGGNRGERPVLAQVAVQVRTVDEIRDERQQLALDDQVADPDDVGVGQAGAGTERSEGSASRCRDRSRAPP